LDFYSYEFLYYWLENINSKGNWNVIPMTVNMFMISCVPDGTREATRSGQQLGVAGRSQAHGRCSTP